MTPRRIRKARQAHQTRTVVIQVPEAISPEVGELIRAKAQKSFPGRRVLVLSRGMTAVTA